MNRSPVRLTGRLPDWSGRKGCERRQARSGNHRPSCKMEPPSRREGPAPALAEGGSSSFICGAFSGNNTAVPAARCRCIAETSIWPAAPIFCGCLRCSSVSVIAFGSTHATTAEHSRVCTVLQLDRSSGLLRFAAANFRRSIHPLLRQASRQTERHFSCAPKCRRRFRYVPGT